MALRQCVSCVPSTYTQALLRPHVARLQVRGQATCAQAEVVSPD